MEDMIGRLLHAGLMTGVGDDPERVDWLRAAATELATDFESSQSVPAAVIACCDQTVSPASPPLAAAESRIREQWETFRNAHPGGDATALLRAVALHALFLAAEEASTAAAMWYLLRNASDVTPSDRFGDVVADALNDLDRRVAGRAESMWVTTASTTQDLRMPGVTSADGAEVSRGPATRLGTAIDEITQLNSPVVLRDELKAPLVDSLNGLAEAVEAALGSEAEKQREALRAFSKSLGGRLREILEEQDRLLAAAALRDRLLWWRLAGRSPGLGNRRYGDLDPATTCVAAALDLVSIVPTLTPVAVEHLLVDVVHGDSEPVDVSIADLRQAATDVDTVDAGVSVPASGRRNPALLLDVVLGGTDEGDLPDSLAKSRPSDEIAVLLFREAQALRLLDAPRE